jgi:hypothetical protein
MLIKMKKCERIKESEEFVLDAFFHIFTLSLILGLFFFFVVAKLERDNLQNEMEDGIKKGLDNITNYPTNPVLSEQLTTMTKLYEKENEADKVYNQGLVYQCLTILVLLLFGLVCVFLTMRWSAHKCPNLGRIVLQNLLLFGAIGVIEFLFFQHIASKFVPVMPSYMAEVISEEL